jgi:hypothetical protein
MKIRKIGAVLAALLWVWGSGAVLLAARPADAAGFGGFRGGGRGGGFGGFRGGGRGFGGFGGFRSPPRAPSGGFGGFRSAPRTPSPGDTMPPITAPGGPRVGTVPMPAPVPTPSRTPDTRVPSSIGTPLPSARPGGPGVQQSTPSEPSSISKPLPGARPEAPSSSGLRFSTKTRPGATQGPLDRRGDTYRGWGGVYVPPGYGYWNVAPYHWLWWVGWPSPYGLYGPGYHASLGSSLLMTLLFLLVAAAVIAVVMVGIRRMSASRYDGMREV